VIILLFLVMDSMLCSFTIVEDGLKVQNPKSF